MIGAADVGSTSGITSSLLSSAPTEVLGQGLPLVPVREWPVDASEVASRVVRDYGMWALDAGSWEGGVGDKRVEGFVYKVLPRRISWEARIDGTSVTARAETRREAVALAVAEATAD